LRLWAERALQMKASSTPRVRSLTRDTADALHFTCKCLIDICLFLLSTDLNVNHQWVAIGFFQQDDIEKHFAHFRMSAGANYYITVEDIAHTHAIDRTKLMLANEPEINYKKAHHACAHCDKSLTESEILLLDDIPGAVSNVSNDEKMALLYIGGYITFKHPELNGSTDWISEEIMSYTEKRDRGGLTFPSEGLFSLLVYAYVFFTKSSEARCRTRLVKIFKDFPSLYHLDVDPSITAMHRIVNILLKQFCCQENAELQQQQRRKVAKLSSV